MVFIVYHIAGYFHQVFIFVGKIIYLHVPGQNVSPLGPRCMSVVYCMGTRATNFFTRENHLIK